MQWIAISLMAAWVPVIFLFVFGRSLKRHCD